MLGGVVSTYYFGSLALAENENSQAFGSALPIAVGSTVTYPSPGGANDLSSIVIGDTSIIITNLAGPGLTYCSDGSSVGAACTDSIDGFAFKFTGENILGATINGATAAGFVPATFGSHVGLDVVDNNDLLIDFTGANPATNGQLIIDLAFSIPPPPVTGVPEPASLGLFGVVVGGIVTTRRRKSKRG